MKVICLIGKAGCGKDTVANYMKDNFEEWGNKVCIMRNADLLKFMLKNFYDWDGEKDVKGRTLLQRVGTDVIRAKNPDFWVNFIASCIHLLKDDLGWDYVIVPDCRFMNEVTVLQDQGFDVVTVYINRDKYTSQLTDEQKKHSSETEMDKMKNPNITIYNNMSINKLEQYVRYVCSLISFNAYNGSNSNIGTNVSTELWNYLFSDMAVNLDDYIVEVCGIYDRMCIHCRDGECPSRVVV